MSISLEYFDKLKEQMDTMCACGHRFGVHAGPMYGRSEFQEGAHPCCGDGTTVDLRDCLCDDFRWVITAEELDESVAGLQEIVADLQ